MKDVTIISMFAENDDKKSYDFQEIFDDKLDIQIGDVYKLGNHYIMCGDATNPEHVKKLMNNNYADLLLTDPPYNVNYEGATVDKLTIQNDNMDDSTFRLFLRNAFHNAFSHLKDGASYYIFHADIEGYNFRGALIDNDIILRQTLIWAKNSLVLGRQDYHWQHEPILYGWKGGASHNWYSDRKQTTLLNFNRPQRNELHPTIKPLDLLIYLITNSTKKGDSVLDLFGGSGSTLLAAEHTNRSAFIMELDPQFVNVIINNYKRLTGIKEVKQ